ncbi:porin family protein, partial [Pseudopedobacter sp.]|uniref:porin family protein n=1 Tax=Pseudopedobacter sp. TaxID=1936787 RepID=UPI00333E3FC8
FSFQPGLSFQGKGYKVDVEDEGISFTDKVNLGYLEIPLNAVLHLPAGDGNVFIGAGPYASFGLFGKEKVESNAPEFESMNEDVKFGNSEDDDIAPMDFGLNFMLGYRLNSGLLFNAGYGLGLANNIPKDLRENDLKYKHKVFSISVGYSF